MKIVSLTLPLSLALAAGCAGESIEPEPPSSRVDLRTALATEDASVVGVTVDPETGARYVFDDQAGVFEVGSDGSANLVMAQMPDPGVAIRYPFTDMVALGNGEFAVTAIGDGFLLNMADETMDLHFCYEPGFFPEELEQRTDSVAYDAASDQIIAQPLTLNEAGDVIASQIGRYSRETGVDLDWFELDVDFVAGGMVAESTASTLLGAGSELFRYTYDGREFASVRDLRAFGVTQIDGLAIDRSTNTLLVLDNSADTLTEIELAKLN